MWHQQGEGGCELYEKVASTKGVNAKAWFLTQNLSIQRKSSPQSAVLRRPQHLFWSPQCKVQAYYEAVMGVIRTDPSVGEVFRNVRRMPLEAGVDGAALPLFLTTGLSVQLLLLPL